MATNGTSFEIDIDAPADSVESAASKVDLLATKLSEAGDAATAASDAVKAAESAYRATESTADRAAKALEKINVALEAQRGKMEAAQAAGDDSAYQRAASAAEKLTRRQAEAADAASKAKAAMEAEAAALDQLKTAASQATDSEEKLTKAHDAAKKAAAEMEKAAPTGSIKDLAEGAKKLGGPLGMLGGVAGDASEGMSKLTTSLGSSGGIYAAIAIAVVALVAAVAALTVAAIAGVGAILKWSIGLSDANRSARLMSQALDGTAAGWSEFDKTIRNLERRLPQTSDELFKMATSLKKEKPWLSGRALEDALEDAAVAAAKLEFGPDFEKQANSLPKLAARFEKNISGIFGNLKIDKLLDGMATLVDLFDETSITGRAIKVVFESLFQPLVDGLTALVPKIVASFIQFEIWALRALIAIKPFGSTILTVVKVLGVMAAVVTGVLVVAIGLVVANLAILAVAVAAVATAAVALVAGVVWLVSKLSDLGVTVGTYLRGAFDDAIKWLGALDLSKIGSDLIAGLVKGITSGATAVVSAITGVVGGAIGAAKSLLGIASPSKVFADIGANTAEGMAGGVEDGTAQVQGSLETMVAPPDSTGTGTSGGVATGGGGTYYLTFGPFSGDPQANAKAARDEFVDFLESIGAVAGVAVPS